MLSGKVIVVEGRSDKQRIQKVLSEPIEIICTNGTVSSSRLEELLVPFEQDEMYIFVDADSSGEKLRALIKREFPEALHLYTDVTYREVATTPLKVIATILLGANIEVRSEFIA
jgi:toprim domain protein